MGRLTPLLLIGGPTAGGKSGLALRLAQACGGEIVNADSMQLYGDLAILTARPTTKEMARAPHHLYGVADAADAWSVGRWLAAARVALADIAARGRTAIVVGGTGLYFRALTEGLADIPPTPAAIRTTVAQAYDSLGEARFREVLGGVDPAAAARIAAGDRQRLTRALEVHEATGRPLSDWQADTRPTLAPSDWRGLVVEPPRAELYRRIDARLAAMVDDGALAEVEALLARTIDPNTPAMKALGVASFAAQLAGALSAPEALAHAQRQTRHYAKRQITWFGRQTLGWEWASNPDSADLVDALLRHRAP